MLLAQLATEDTGSEPPVGPVFDPADPPDPFGQVPDSILQLRGGG